VAEVRLTRHVARAALHVAAILGETSTPVVVARESYWRRATGGIFSTADLILAENALVAAGFVIRDGEVLTIAPLLDGLVDVEEDDAIDLLATALFGMRSPADAAERAAVEAALEGLVDPGRREGLLLTLGRRWDDQYRREVGAVGEELVVAYARDELTALGHPELARAVRRVSLLSDQLGYDIVAPRIGGSPRLLEVKATTNSTQAAVYLSRAETDTGERFSDWALVVCVVHDVAARTGELLGWCQGSDLQQVLPVYVRGSRWQSVAIEVDRLALQPGLPRPSE
jgi:hypothetical protein